MKAKDTLSAKGRTIPEMLQDRLQELLPKLPPEVAEVCGKELWAYLEPRVVTKQGSHIVPRKKSGMRADNCVECGLPLYTCKRSDREDEARHQPGAVKHGGEDRCLPCFRAKKKAERLAEAAKS